MTNFSVARKLGYFVALSVLAHVWLMYGVPFEMPHFEDVPFTLQARLQPAPPLPPVLPRAQPKRAAAPAAESLAAPPLSNSTPVYAPSPVTAPAPAAADTPVDTPVTPPPVVAESKPAIATPPLAPRLPRKGEIVYALYLGNDRFNVGRTLQSWEISGDSYRLASTSETTGLASLFSRQRIAYESRGKLTANGLRPDHFTTERVRSGKSEKATADFNWNDASAAIDNPPRTVALPANTQDLVSFMYQLGLTPLTPGRMELPITNGWKLERYELEIGIEEMLETPFGALRAVPVKQVRRAEQETIELWLAPAYRWLPVRIRFFNRAGEPAGEQLVSEIRVSDD